jgi:hypothetical protein
MSGVTFDPDARTEFLAAIEYYEESRPGLGYRFRLIVESAVHNAFPDRGFNPEKEGIRS